MDSTQQHVDVIREVFKYAQAFAGKTFVLQIDDAVTEYPAFVSLVGDLVLLHRAGIRIVLVAGARSRIDEILTRYHVDTDRYRGVRIATSDAIPFIKMAAFDAANRLMTLLSGHRVNAMIGNWSKPSCRRSARVADSPSCRGICTSIRTAS